MLRDASGWNQLAEDGVTIGPFDSRDIRDRIENRQLLSTSLVSHELHTSGNWVLANQVIAFKPWFESQSHADTVSEIAIQMRDARRTKLKRSRSLPIANSVLVTVTLLLLAGLVWIVSRPGLLNRSETIATLKEVMTTEPEKKLIRAFLERETPTGHWEEIAWSKISSHSGDEMTCLEFRTENTFGGTTKTHLAARYYHKESKVAMQGYLLRGMEWVDPRHYGLPAVDDTPGIRPNPAGAIDHNLLEGLQRRASERMSRRRLGGE